MVPSDGTACYAIVMQFQQSGGGAYCMILYVIADRFQPVWRRTIE